MNAWVAVLAVGAASYVFRVVPLLLADRLRLGPGFDRAIRHAGAAILTALLVDSIRGNLHGGRPFAAAIAIVVGFAIAVRGASMLRIVAVGAGAFAAAAALGAVL